MARKRNPERVARNQEVNYGHDVPRYLTTSGNRKKGFAKWPAGVVQGLMDVMPAHWGNYFTAILGFYPHIHMSQSTVAERLNRSREQTNRVLAEMAKVGMIMITDRFDPKTNEQIPSDITLPDFDSSTTIQLIREEIARLKIEKAEKAAKKKANEQAQKGVSGVVAGCNTDNTAVMLGITPPCDVLHHTPRDVLHHTKRQYTNVPSSLLLRVKAFRRSLSERAYGYARQRITEDRHEEIYHSFKRRGTGATDRLGGQGQGGGT